MHNMNIKSKFDMLKTKFKSGKKVKLKIPIRLPNPLNTSIRNKIIFIVIIAVLVPISLSTYISGITVADKIENASKTRLFDTLDSVTSNLEDYQKKAKYNAAILSSSAELRQYCMESSNLKASQYLVQLCTEIGLDYAMIADKDKKLLTRTDQPMKHGDDLSNDFMIKSGFAGFKNTSIQASDKGLVVQSVSPIMSSNAATGVQTIGAILVQYNIDKRFVESIKKTNGVEASLYVQDKTISTLGDAKPELKIDSSMQNKLVKSKDKQIEKKKINGKFYSIAYKPITNSKAEIVGILSIAMPQDEVITAKKNVQLQILLIGLAGILFATLFAAFTSKSIVGPISRLVKDTKTVAEGNLKYKSNINSKDEVGQLAHEFNAMADSLRSLILQVMQTITATEGSSNTLITCINDVNEISRKVEAISESIRQGSQEQFEYLNQTKDEIASVSASAAEISNQTEEIVRNTDSARLVVEKEANSLKELSSNMNLTKETILDMTNKIDHFKANLQQVRKAVEIITGISGQTKLLALNAAIEAARAGEVGRGFGVVAEEIRKLSDESNSSVGVINGIIKALFEEMETTTNVVKESVKSFELSSAIASNTERSFGEIVKTINSTNRMISEIADKAGMQAANTDKITNIISGVSAISQDAASQSELMHEGALKQSRQLDELAEELDNLMKNIENTRSVVSTFSV